GEHGALARIEELGGAPVRQRIAFLERKPIGERQGRHVLAQHVLRVGEMAHADDHDLAQSPGKRRLPAHCIGVIEPALGEPGSGGSLSRMRWMLISFPGRPARNFSITSANSGWSCSWIRGTRAMNYLSLHFKTGRLHDRRPARKLLADELPRRVRSRVEDRLE